MNSLVTYQFVNVSNDMYGNPKTTMIYTISLIARLVVSRESDFRSVPYNRPVFVRSFM